MRSLSGQAHNGICRFVWVTCVHDEAAHCNNVRPHSTLSPHYSAYGPGNANGVVIFVVQFCHQNMSGATTDSARRCFTYSKLEPLAALDGRVPVRNTLANMFPLFLLKHTTNENRVSDNSVDMTHEHITEGPAISFAACDQHCFRQRSRSCVFKSFFLTRLVGNSCAPSVRLGHP